MRRCFARCDRDGRHAHAGALVLSKLEEWGWLSTTLGRRLKRAPTPQSLSKSALRREASGQQWTQLVLPIAGWIGISSVAVRIADPSIAPVNYNLTLVLFRDRYGLLDCSGLRCRPSNGPRITRLFGDEFCRFRRCRNHVHVRSLALAHSRPR